MPDELTKQQRHLLMRPPPKQHHNRHPKQHKLYTQINTPRLGKLVRTLGLQHQYRPREIQRSDTPVRGVTQQREQDDSEPLGADRTLVSDLLDAQDEPFGGDGDEGDCDD